MKLLFLQKTFIFQFLTLIISYNIFFTSLASENLEKTTRLKKLSDQLRCPTCQGLSIKDSDAGFSKIIKGKIIELIDNGKSDEEIINFFVKRYGEWILRSPLKKGFNLLLWILPSIGILLGLSWVFLRLKVREKNYEDNKLTELTHEEEEKVENDLKVFERD